MLVTLGTTLNVMGEADFKIDLDRSQFRHAWLLGKSGTGKSTLLRQIIVEAMRQGLGVAVIDPHGDLIYDCLNYIPQDRLKDIVYIDPENSRIPDLGILDYPDKSRALRIFMTLIEAHSAEGWGKQTASILRNVTRGGLEAIKHPTIVHIYLMLADDDFAQKTFKKCKNPITRRFYELYWAMPKKDRIEKFSHPLNKIEELMEPGIVEFLAQSKSLNFRKMMDEQKIVLCRIPKAYLEERGARILGSFLMMKFKVEAARRKKRKKQFLIVADEFHNFTGGIDVDTTFGESRKYGTHYIVTSQTRKQLGENADVIAGIRICISPDCKIHGKRHSTSSRALTPAEKAKREKDIAAEKLKEEKRVQKEREELADALKKVKWPISRMALNVMFEGMLEDPNDLEGVCERRGIDLPGKDGYKDEEKAIRKAAEKMSDLELARLMVELAIVNTYNDDSKKERIKML